MPNRQCLTCRKLITKGSYCKVCTRTKGHQSPEYQRNRQIVLSTHLKRYGNRCLGDERHPAHPCTVFEVDHITPLGRGGTNHPSNLRVLCKKANRGGGGNHYSTVRGRTIQPWRDT